MDVNERSVTTAKRLKELRKSNNLTFSALADKFSEEFGISISESSLKNYEKVDGAEKTFPNKGMRIEYIWCLAAIYNVSADYILGIPNKDALAEPTENEDETEDQCDNYINLSLSPKAHNAINELGCDQKEALEKLLNHGDLNELLTYIGAYYVAAKKARNSPEYPFSDLEDALTWGDVEIPYREMTKYFLEKAMQTLERIIVDSE